MWRGQRVVERVTVARRHMKRQTEGRTVLLHPEARAALAAWLAEVQAAGPCPPTTYVFQSRKGANRPISRRQALRILREVYDTNELTGWRTGGAHGSGGETALDDGLPSRDNSEAQ